MGCRLCQLVDLVSMNQKFQHKSKGNRDGGFSQGKLKVTNGMQ